MVASLIQHAEFLFQNHETRSSNLVTTEMSGLAAVAVAFPEALRSSPWFKESLSAQSAEALSVAYPVGVQTEQTTTYHMVTLQDLAGFQDLAEKAGRGSGIPKDFVQVVDGMRNYIALSADGTCHSPMNSDASLSDVSSFILNAANTRNRKDWLYAATRGKEGTPPSQKGQPGGIGIDVSSGCVVFPWSGQLVMRSDSAHGDFHPPRPSHRPERSPAKTSKKPTAPGPLRAHED